MMDIKEHLILLSTSFFDKKTTGSGINMGAKPKEKVTEELHKLIIRKFKKRAAYSGFKDNIWGVDLADMQLICKFNKGFRFLLCVRFLVNMPGLFL